MRSEASRIRSSSARAARGASSPGRHRGRGRPGPAPRAAPAASGRRRVREELAELLAELALADVRVPVAIRAERRAGVVDVQRAQPVEPDRAVELASAGGSAPLRSRTSTPETQRWHESRQTPSRGCRSSRSTTVASSSIERPIVPPAPAEFSSSSHVRSEQSSSTSRERRHRPLEPGLEAGAEVRAEVEDDAVRLDRARRLHRLPHRVDALAVELVVRAREVDEVDRVHEHRLHARARARARRSPRARRGRASGKRQARGLWTKSWSGVGADRRGPLRRGLDAAARRGRRTARLYDSEPMSVRVRMAPSPTGLLHIGERPHGALQLALRPPPRRRVPAADREHGHVPRGRRGDGADPGVAALARARLGRPGHVPARPASSAAQEEARRLLAEGKAYEDEGAIRFRMPDEGVDRVGRRRARPHRGAERVARGRRHPPLGRPPDVQLRLAGRGLARRDHARHPRSRPRLEHAEADPAARRRSARRCPCTRTCRTSTATDGRKLSKRHGAVTVEEFRAGATCPRRSSTSSRCSAGATTTRRRS